MLNKIFTVIMCVGLPYIAVTLGFDLMGNTGGYIIGFVLSGLIYALITKLIGEKPWSKLISAFLGLIVCYIAGTLWFAFTAAQSNSFFPIIMTCVIPYVIPDTVKILLAFFITKRTEKFTRSDAR